VSVLISAPVYQIEPSLLQVVGEAVCSCARKCGPVLAGVKVGPARVRGADPGRAPPGPRLRAGWFGAYQEQAEVWAAVDRFRGVSRPRWMQSRSPSALPGP
jgi:hypothetical protein